MTVAVPHRGAGRAPATLAHVFRTAAGRFNSELSRMTDSDVQLVKQAIPLWYANRLWAEELLIRAFGLANAQDVLRHENRHHRQIPGTCWFIRPHGIGVDIFKAPGVGGIDFDFDKPDPDEWRLARFIEAQVNDGQLPYQMYRELLDDEDRFDLAISIALNEA